MKRSISILVSVVIVCILTGCGSLERQATSGNPLPKDYSAPYHITLEREVLVDLNEPDSDSAPQKLTETLRLICRIQPVSRHDGRYRVAFEEVSASRTDFLHQVILTDPVDDLAGKSFEIHIDELGRIVKADTLMETLKTLAHGCAECPQQEHDCGQRKVKDQNFLLDVWSIQELMFNTFKVAGNPSQAEGWTHARQLPSVLPGEAPSVTTVWDVGTNNSERVIASGHETLDLNATYDSLPELFHPHIRPKGLLGYLRNCTYDSINGQVTLEAEAGTGLPLQITREAAMNATAYFTLSRPPQRPSITVWETLKIQQSPVLQMYSSDSP